ncbi:MULTISPECIES: lipopolysaccharide biosynthesis protein [unclassified Blastococcus]
MTSDSPARQVLRNLALRFAVIPVSAVCGLASARIVITDYGLAIFGVASLIGTLLLLVPFLDLGLGAAVMDRAARMDRGPNMAQWIGKAIRWLFVVGALLLLLSVLQYWTDIADSILGDASTVIDGRTVFGGWLAILAVTLPASLGQRLLIGAGQTHLATVVSAVTAPVGLLIVAAAAIIEAPAELVVLAVPIALGLTSMLGLALGLRGVAVSWIDVLYAVRRGRGQKELKLGSVAVPMFAISIGLPIVFESHRLLLAHMSSLAALAAYSLIAQLYAPLWSSVSSGGMSLWHGFASMTDEGRNPARQWRNAFVTLSITGAVLAATLVAFADIGVHLISGAQADADYGVVWAFAVLLMLQSVHLTSGMFLTDALGLRMQARSVTVMAITSLGLGLLITPVAGAAGPIWASSAALLVCQLAPCLLAVRSRLRRRDESLGNPTGAEVGAGDRRWTA